MDPKHQFAAQYVLSRAAAERRERETLLAAAAAAASSSMSMGMNGHMFPNMSMSGMAGMSGMPGMATSSSGGAGGMSGAGLPGAPLTTAASATSPSAHSDSSSRISTPAEAGGQKMEPPRPAAANSSAAPSMIQHTANLPPAGNRMELERASVTPSGGPSSAGGSDHVGEHPLNSGPPPPLQRLDRMDHNAQQRLGMLNRLGMQYPMVSHPSTGPSMLTSAPPPRHTDSMRAMIQQTQAELVKSTLTSQAESARSLDMLRSLTTQASESMMVQPDFRFLQADLQLRSSHDVRPESAGGHPGGMMQSQEQLNEALRLQESLRLHHDPRAAFGFLQPQQQQQQQSTSQPN